MVSDHERRITISRESNQESQSLYHALISNLRIENENQPRSALPTLHGARNAQATTTETRKPSRQARQEQERKGSGRKLFWRLAMPALRFGRMYRLRPSPTSHDHADWTGACARVVRRRPSWSEAKSLKRSSARGTCVQRTCECKRLAQRPDGHPGP